MRHGTRRSAASEESDSDAERECDLQLTRRSSADCHERVARHHQGGRTRRQVNDTRVTTMTTAIADRGGYPPCDPPSPEGYPWGLGPPTRGGPGPPDPGVKMGVKNGVKMGVKIGGLGPPRSGGSRTPGGGPGNFPGAGGRISGRADPPGKSGKIGGPDPPGQGPPGQGVSDPPGSGVRNGAIFRPLPSSFYT